MARICPCGQSDPLFLHQVFLNIILNAEHAIAASGRPGRIEVTPSRCRGGIGVVATIRDTGAGHRPGALPRIFEPFFTTKDVGKGTGLGLAIAYGIVRSTEGHISAGNHPDGGAVFTVELPVASARPTTTEDGDMIDETFLTTEEVLEYLQVNLRTVYRLIKAGKFRRFASGASGDSGSATSTRGSTASGGPRTARRVARPAARPAAVAGTASRAGRRRRGEHSRSSRENAGAGRIRGRRRPRRPFRARSDAHVPPDLLIVDLKMPGMDGLSVIREAKRYKTDLPVIVITGFSTESSAIEAINLGVSGYLTKPFRVPRSSSRPRRHWAVPRKPKAPFTLLGSCISVRVQVRFSVLVQVR